MTERAMLIGAGMHLGQPACHDLSSISEVVPLSETTRELLANSSTLDSLLEAMVERRLFGDAIAVIAQVLPTRLAVWWMTLSAWRGCRAVASDHERQLMGAAVHWVCEPTEERRSVAESASKGHILDHPAVNCAYAAAHGGAAGGPNEPILGGKEWLVAGMVVPTLRMAGDGAVRQTQGVPQRTFFEIGREITRGRLLWSAAAEKG